MKIKIAILSVLATVATALTAISQTAYPTAAYSPVTVPLPPGVATIAPGVGTNFLNGWLTTSTTTNTSIVYSQATGAFVTNTIITTNSANQFSQFFCGFQSDVGIQLSFQGSTNIQLTLARSANSGQPDTINNFPFNCLGYASQTNVYGYMTGATNIPEPFIASFGYLYVVGITNLDGVHTASNIVVTAANERHQ